MPPQKGCPPSCPCNQTRTLPRSTSPPVHKINWTFRLREEEEVESLRQRLQSLRPQTPTTLFPPSSSFQQPSSPRGGSPVPPGRLRGSPAPPVVGEIPNTPTAPETPRFSFGGGAAAPRPIFGGGAEAFRSSFEGGAVTPRPRLGGAPGVGSSGMGASATGVDTPPSHSPSQPRSPQTSTSRLSLSPSHQQPSSPRGGSPVPPGVDVSALSSGDRLSLGDKYGKKPAPYDVSAEKMPDHRFFSTEFQGMLQGGLEIARGTVAAIDRLTAALGDDDTMADLRKDAQRLSSFRATDTKTIAVVGNDGPGKGSLISSLLDFKWYGKISNTFVTEYHQKQDRHSAPITIEVECMTQSEIEDFMSELLWSYRQPYLSQSPNTPTKDKVRSIRESSQAWSVLKAAFGHHGEISEERLQDMSPFSLGRLTAQLWDWSREIEWPEGVTGGQWTSTAESELDCMKETWRFRNNQMMHFTKAMRIYVDAQVLKTGVTIAVLPDLQDANLARVQATQDYLKRCDNIFVVTDIARATNDSSLCSSFFSDLSRYKPQIGDESRAKNLNIAIVCTGAGKLNPKEAGEKLCITDNRLAPILVEVERDIEAAKAAGNGALVKKLKQRYKFTLIRARNGHLKERLQAEYASKTPGCRMEVFCVSDILYINDSNPESVLLSEIPALRRFCHSIAADAQLREAKHYLRSPLLRLVTSLDTWTANIVHREEAKASEETSEKMERLNSQEEAFEQHCTQVGNAVTKLRKDFESSFKEQVLDLAEKCQEAWETAATSEAKKWRTWHPLEYESWCRNDGDYETEHRRENWNARIIWKMRTDLAFQWDLVEEDIPELYGALTESVRTALADLKDTILDLFGEDFCAPMTDAVESGLRKLESQWESSEQRFRERVQLIRRYASESNLYSYVLNEMLPAYRSAKAVSGAGAWDRQRAIIEGQITDGALFPKMLIKMGHKITILASTAERELFDDAWKVQSQILDDLELLKQKLEETPSEKTRRMKELADVVGSLRNDVYRIGDELEADMSRG